MRKLSSLPKRQEGLVLILALLIVVLVTSLVVSTSWRFELGMSRNENRWHGVQGRMVLEGGEALVGKLLLMEDFNDPAPDGDADHLREMWNDPVTVPIDGGAITAQVEDAQGRFNINLLSILPPVRSKQEEQECTKDETAFECMYTVAQRRFIRLLQAIRMNEQQVSPEEAAAITDAIIDWMDPKSDPRGYGGAEQSYYNGLEVPIVVPNAPMTSISELSLVKGVRERPELYEKLLPLVIALPAGGGEERVAYININTMPDIMFRMFNEKSINIPLDEEMGSALVTARNDVLPLEIGDGRQGYQKVEDFVNALVSDVQAVTDDKVFDSSQLVISTNYFIYSAEVMLGDKTRRSKALIWRKKGQKPKTLWRTDANF